MARIGVPDLYVRGNHGSLAPQAAVDRFPNAVVLDRSTVVEVAGLRWRARATRCSRRTARSTLSARVAGPAAPAGG